MRTTFYSCLLSILAVFGSNSSASAQDMPQVSDESTTYWYVIQNQAGDAVRYGLNLCAGTTVGSNLYGSKTETQLWKIVVDELEGGYDLVNENGYYASSTLVSNNLSCSDIPTAWEIEAQTNGTSVGFRFITLDGGTVLHQRNNPMSKEDPTLYIMNYTPEDKASIWKFTSITDMITSNITTLSNLLAKTPEGSAFGQYATAARTALQTKINEFKALTLSTLSVEQLKTLNADIQTAKQTYMASINMDMAQLISTAESPKWFKIVSNSGLTYCQDSVMTADGVTELGKTFLFESPVQKSDKQLWRFETDDDGNWVGIVNKATGWYMNENGDADAEPTTTFTLKLLEDGVSFNIIPAGKNPLHAQKTGLEIVTYQGGAGTASAWKFVEEKTNTAISSVATDNCKVYVANGKVVVEGSENYSVFTIAGQQVNAKATLGAGVYVVKVNNKAIKVVVK